LSIIKSNTADSVLLAPVGAGFDAEQNETRQDKSKRDKSKVDCIVQSCVASLYTTSETASPLQRLMQSKSGPCQITQLEETGEQPLSAVLDFVGSIILDINKLLTIDHVI
jgi:hypothetical protein